jgi:hypothetical protein
MELTERETEKGLFASGIVTTVCWAVIGAFLLALASCTSTLQNAGDVGFRYSTEFAFFHRAAKTSGGDADSVAMTNTEFPALVSYIMGPPAPEPTPEGTLKPNP